jgi:2-oxoglutarate dehydrogenase E1 component
LGPNAWLVEEMHEAFRADPDSVSPSWREFFTGYDGTSSAPSHTTPNPSAANPSATTPAPATPAPATPAPGNGTAPGHGTTPPATATAPPTPADAAATGSDVDVPEPIRGVGKRIVENMEASLGVPTATSFREVPAKLLEII